MLQWKGNKHYTFWVCAYRLRYPERNVYVPYYTVICCLSGSKIFFSHYLINGTISEK